MTRLRRWTPPPAPQGPLAHECDPTYRGLLDAILADPADLGPRLILADWLEERELEPERVAMIRQSRIPYTNSGRRAGRELASRLGLVPTEQPRSWYIVDDLGDRWLSDVHGCAIWFGRVAVGYGVRHGFVSEVYAPPGWWVRNGPALVRVHPVADVLLLGVHPWDSVHFNFYGLEGRGWVRGADRLDPRLFDELPGGRPGESPSPGGPRRRLDYQTEYKAYAAMSHACVNWARKEAGMCPLPRSPLVGPAMAADPTRPIWGNRLAIDILGELYQARVWYDLTDSGEIELSGGRLDDRLRGLVDQHREEILAFIHSRRNW
jgi:uncharacterized protein (TIGR02996 family)